MRPYFTIGNEKWDSKAEKSFSVPVEKMIKGQKYYEGFIEKHKKFPTKDELILFYYNRYVMADKCKTLPYLIDRWSEEIVGEHNKVFKETKFSVEQVISLLEKSRPIEIRQKM